jgi:polyribonucleotide nucleotidyltransferase
MSKTRHINLRIPESDFKKIEAMLNGRTLTQFFRGLVKLAVEKEREDANNFLQLMQKIDSSDLSKIAEKVERIEQANLSIQETLGSAGKVDMEKIMRYLNRILTESAKARISIERYAGRDFQHAIFQLFEADVKVQFKSYVEDWNKQKGGD